jgi:hypothetical protein
MRSLLFLILLGGAASAKGLYTEGNLGGQLFLGNTSDSAAPGPTFGVRAGYQPSRLVSFGLHLGGSIHEATGLPPPSEEFFQLYTVAIEGRLAFSSGRFSFFLADSAGVAVISTNVLDRAGVTEPHRHVSVFLQPGAGVELRLQDPHFSVGVAGNWGFYPMFGTMQSVGVHAYLRYAK